MQLTATKEQRNPCNNQRIYYLDSIRGIASVTVVMAHLASVYAQDTLLKIVIQSLGRSAVILFFLLSGLSLGLSLINRNTTRFNFREYTSYLIKRFIRVYLPFFICLFFSYVLFLNIQSENIVGVSNQFNSIGISINWNIFLENMFMTGSNVALINPVIWSLIIELRLSIIFPFLFFLVFYRKLPAFIFLIVTSFIFGTIVLYAVGNYLLIGQSIFHIGFFTIGIGLSLIWDQPKRMPKKFLFTLGIFSGILYFHVIFLTIFEIKNVQFISDIIIGIGSTGILIVCHQNTAIQSFLTHKTYLNLGKISFSLYLVHSVALVLMLRILSPFFSITAVELIAVPIIFMTAYLCYFIIEKPSKLFGQYLGYKILRQKK